MEGGAKELTGGGRQGVQKLWMCARDGALSLSGGSRQTAESTGGLDRSLMMRPGLPGGAGCLLPVGCPLPRLGSVCRATDLM